VARVLDPSGEVTYTVVLTFGGDLPDPRTSRPLFRILK